MSNALSDGAIGETGVSLAFGFVVAGMIYTVGHLSGAHINPAVTIGFWSVGRFPRSKVPIYLAAQVLGAIAASVVLQTTLGNVAFLGATVPAVDVHAAFILEWLLSFVLMFVIMAVATDERAVRSFAGPAVGLTVAFDALMGGPLTGASMNPARSFGPALIAGVWTAHWLYWLAPVGAMITAAWAYEALRGEDPIAPQAAIPESHP